MLGKNIILYVSSVAFNRCGYENGDKLYSLTGQRSFYSSFELIPSKFIGYNRIKLYIRVSKDYPLLYTIKTIT